jgi:hypothetical protein
VNTESLQQLLALLGIHKKDLIKEFAQNNEMIFLPSMQALVMLHLVQSVPVGLAPFFLLHQITFDRPAV